MTYVWRILVAGLLLTGIVAWMITDRVLILANGREIVVATAPVDPRDLFRGDYVRLDYDFSRIDFSKMSRLGQNSGWTLEKGSTIYAVLKPEGDRFVLEDAGASRVDVPADRVVLKGKVTYKTSSFVQADFGIGRYFVPQGHGRAIETGIADRRTEIVLAVTEDGRAAIKSLRLDGKDVYREGLF